MRLLIVSVIGVATLLGGGAARAQALSQGALSQDLNQSAPSPAAGPIAPAPRPLMTFGNTNLVVNAPVTKPDSNLAMQTFEGQPMTGKDAVLSQAGGTRGP